MSEDPDEKCEHQVRGKKHNQRDTGTEVYLSEGSQCVREDAGLGTGERL